MTLCEARAPHAAHQRLKTATADEESVGGSQREVKPTGSIQISQFPVLCHQVLRSCCGLCHESLSHTRARTHCSLNSFVFICSLSAVLRSLCSQGFSPAASSFCPAHTFNGEAHVTGCSRTQRRGTADSKDRGLSVGQLRWKTAPCPKIAPSLDGVLFLGVPAECGAAAAAAVQRDGQISGMYAEMRTLTQTHK